MVQKCPSQLVCLPPPLFPGLSSSSSSSFWSLHLLMVLLLVSLPPHVPPPGISSPLPPGLSTSSSSSWSLYLLLLRVSPPPDVLLSLPGRGVKVEDILQDDQVLTSFLLRDVPLTQSVVYNLLKARIRPEQVTSSALLSIT